ncbi:MAG: hypothetical protein JF599_04815 [Verrucomicrobia bacterium]|nr:hypothetical protein [Verrucomicrobiota bacterium]
MNPIPSARLALALAAGLFATGFAFAADSLDLAKAKAAYPLDTCVVSGEKLEPGDMGDPIDYVYKQEGKPDRLVRFCCKMCVAKFKKNPAKYLQTIDEAAAKTAAPAASAK